MHLSKAAEDVRGYESLFHAVWLSVSACHAASIAMRPDWVADEVIFVERLQAWT
jgi:hypothetical protein